MRGEQACLDQNNMPIMSLPIGVSLATNFIRYMIFALMNQL